jgi:hypothetical protein
MASHSVKGKIHDSSQKNDNHNCMDSPRFYVIKILPKGKPFNATHYIKHILQLILELRPKYVRHRFIIRADNARPHMISQSQEFYEQNSLRIALYPPYSPDSALSYFFLFGYVNHYLKEHSYPSKQTLLIAIHIIFRNHFECHVEGLDGETDLSRRI